MQKQPDSIPRFGKRGEYLVAIQVLLMAGFAVTPPWPVNEIGSSPTGLATIRWLLLLLCWSASLFFGVGGFLAIRNFLTPLPYPVDDNQLVSSGVYRLVRHPLYTSILLALAGWTIFALSIIHLLITAGTFIFFNHKASIEEAWLTERHPDYPGYVQRVGKFFPSFRKR
ncbi:MAG: isoprenylcysteine carboxylmethyltransferase family protein [Chlorobiaceae bacterium]|nr:isoprenylcysteine carboxylmethyltransferase family protein [Chlorobiaceae bacterium]NTW74399.1 isoprenylcysteine carboxylmethyltransferase family protein [Chlorobiaceae bacterium]